MVVRIEAWRFHGVILFLHVSNYNNYYVSIFGLYTIILSLTTLRELKGC